MQKNLKKDAMKDNKKISIIVPIYNIEKYLEECINSIVNQTYINLEIILVDDGSTDTSGQICDRYADKDQRIVVIHKQNGGLVSARKAGLNIATGEYIAFVDGDDWIELDMYEKLLLVIIKNKADFAESGYYNESEKTGICKEYSLDNLIINVTQKSIEQIICKWMKDNTDCFVRSTIWSKLYKASLIKEAYSFVPNDMSRGEDFINYINLLKFSQNKIIVTPRIFYHYRNRESSLSHDKSFAYYVINQDLYAYMKRLINNYFPNLNTHVEEWRLLAAKEGFKAVIYNNANINIQKPKYNINNIEKLFNKKIVLYGAGAVGKDYYFQIVKYEKCQLIAWIDKNYFTCNHDYYSVKPITYFFNINYDIIVIAVLREKLAESIKTELLNMGIQKEKIVWIKPYNICDELK